MDAAAADRIGRWLVGEGRLIGDGVAIVGGFGRRLVAAGAPLLRIRIGHRIANPLVGAWGVVWERDSGDASEYSVARDARLKDWFGSPIERVIATAQPVRQRLVELAADAHPWFLDEAGRGGADYLALPIRFGDGSTGVAALVGDRPAGFTDDEIALLTGLAEPLAAALEPSAMRRSAWSLLATYLGRGPATAAFGGAFQRGDRSTQEAAVLFADLAGFTALAESLDEAALLAALDSYFGVVVGAIEAEGGEVLKFIGDGVLAIFPIGDARTARAAVAATVRAIAAARTALAQERPDLAFTAALHVGPVVYGNIGAPGRLDFTVVGPTVNLVSRLEGVAKAAGRPTVASAAAAALLDGPADPLGSFDLRGIAEPQPAFALP